MEEKEHEINGDSVLLNTTHQKRFLVLIGIVVLVVGFGVLLLLVLGSRSSSDSEVVLNNQSNTENPVVEEGGVQSVRDSDNDGLADWEERLWKTDPNNPDTDGDGTSDGDEVLLGRNPLKPGPDDVGENSLLVTNPDYATIREKVQVTQPSPLISVSKPKEEPIFDARHDYGNKLASLFLSISKNTEVYNRTFTMLLESSGVSESVRERVEEMVADYMNLANSVFALERPTNVETEHMGLFNSIKGYTENITLFSEEKFAGDIGQETYMLYVNSALQMNDSLKALALYFDKEGVVFQANEPAYFFTQFAQALKQ